MLNGNSAHPARRLGTLAVVALLGLTVAVGTAAAGASDVPAVTAKKKCKKKHRFTSSAKKKCRKVRHIACRLRSFAPI